MIDFNRTSRRLTSAGIQYCIQDDVTTHIVTVNAASIGCSCGLICSHVGEVEAQETAYRVEAVKRARYSATFDIY